MFSDICIIIAKAQIRIETQDTILADCKARRIVEIGPGETLTHMAKITLNRKYQSFDAAHTLRRELYSYKKNTRELYFENLPTLQEPKPAPVPVNPIASTTAVQPQAENAPLTQTPRPAVRANAIQDIPVTAAEIIKLIVSTTLRKDAASVPDSSSIKELSGGMQ
jgi:fatty acid synthase subunit alpha